MLNRHIELIPGESICVGNLTVTLLFVEGGEATLKIEDPDGLCCIETIDAPGNLLCEPVTV